MNHDVTKSQLPASLFRLNLLDGGVSDSIRLGYLIERPGSFPRSEPMSGAHVEGLGGRVPMARYGVLVVRALC